MVNGPSQRDDLSSLLRDISSDAGPDSIGDSARGAVLRIDLGTHVGEDRLEALERCARCCLTFEHHPAVAADEPEGGIELIDLALGIARDLHELVDQAFPDHDVELIGCRGSRAAAGILEDQLIAQPLADTAWNGS